MSSVDELTNPNVQDALAELLLALGSEIHPDDYREVIVTYTPVLRAEIAVEKLQKLLTQAS